MCSSRNMSETDQTYRSALPSSDSVRDIFLWKKKKQSVLLLSIATATWVLLKVYLFNFLTVISWAAMFVVTSLFLWANMLREPPNLYEMLGVTEETALRTSMDVLGGCRERVVCGVIMGMTIPVIYARYKENLKRSEEWVKGQTRKYYDMVDEKVVKNIKNKVTVTKENYKEKKIE
ncbi:hypothetical protein ACLB2K_005921 [Fragaria x ananassa]